MKLHQSTSRGKIAPVLFDMGQLAPRKNEMYRLPADAADDVATNKVPFTKAFQTQNDLVRE